MNAIVYVNTPLEAPEHAALAALAKKEGRAKGQQLRLLAIQAMRVGASAKSTTEVTAKAAADAGHGVAAVVRRPAPTPARARACARKGGQP